ncbi:DUF5994 family protein [Plantactinospora sp. BB1]|uniref:DUF5994 family protein n=1 Tax=Plantactinospora sp. BB1 TaxID=2071627 RepID=UPI00131F3CB2|nr:DUF5994 family protein [Plantactinospora sp. BB1]
MLTAGQRATRIPSTPPSQPRLSLPPARASGAVLDGAWWPRSWDPLAELPGLMVALSARYGRVRNVVLNSAAWDGRFRRFVAGDDVIRAGWFSSLEPALLVATTEAGDQIDLLVVPPGTTAAAAERVMTMAADPANTLRAPAILAADGNARTESTGSPGGDRRADHDGYATEPVTA